MASLKYSAFRLDEDILIMNARVWKETISITMAQHTERLSKSLSYFKDWICILSDSVLQKKCIVAKNQRSLFIFSLRSLCEYC